MPGLKRKKYGKKNPLDRNPSGPIKFSRRSKTVRVKAAKGRKLSSTRWLTRQLNDPYVAEAKIRGYRSRSAFKLIELDKKFNLFKRGDRVIDLGAAPGGWTQVAVERCIGGTIVSLDITKMDEIPGAKLIFGDFFSKYSQDQLREAIGESANVVLTDMAESLSGHQKTDHLRIVAALETTIEFAVNILIKDGIFVGKVFQGGAEKNMLDYLNKIFNSVDHFKPPASRKESPEIYLVARGFKGK